MKIKTYENLRKLAIIDAKRRLSKVAHLIPNWDIVDKEHKNGDIEKLFTYRPTISLMITLDLNSYATIREIKYIVWRFDIGKDDMMKDLKGEENEEV